MSKYIKSGVYHYQDFANPNTAYAKHVDDLIDQLRFCVGRDMDAHDFGCGEGLIMDQLAKRLEWRCSGNDLDQVAISMARRLMPNAPLHHGAPSGTFDVILFCDSLEHMVAWKEHLEWAKRSANWLVIAVPDRHDPHGEQDFKPDFADAILSGWEIAHRATRHARHLTIWKRPCAS